MTFLSSIPASLHQFVLFRLHQALPPAPDDSAEMLEARNEVAKLAVARLAPMNTAEALLAIQAVVSEAHALDALHGAVLYRHDPAQVMRSRAQSALMTRQAGQARKELRLMQEARWEAERQRQAEIEAERQATEDAERRADEAMVVPFMRRLGQRRAAAQQSHSTGRNPMSRSRETDPRQLPPSSSSGDTALPVRAGGTVPKRDGVAAA